MSTSSSVVLNDLSFSWPDGTAVLDRVTGAFGRGRTGLVGANGAGKSTLLRLIAGDLWPTHGTISTSGTVEHLRQDVTRNGGTVSDLLGITEVREALRAVEGGSIDPQVFEVIGDHWDIEDRAQAHLAALALPTALDRRVPTLSGGEAMLTALAGVRLRGADITLLDEPTNNLDRSSRQRLYDVIGAVSGTLIVVSHDLELLDLMDATAELRSGELTSFGGPFGEYQSWLATQQDAAEQAVRAAEQALRRQQRERAKAEERIAHSERRGRQDRLNRKYVPAVVNDRRNSAEKAQGSRRRTTEAKTEAAREAVTLAQGAVRDDATIRVDLPDPQVPRGRRIAELRGDGGRTHVIRGPERVALTGDNGVGKTTMLEALVAGSTVRAGYLPQQIVLDDHASVLDVVSRVAPALTSGEVRNRLARLLIRGDMVERHVGALSGGERFRVALAQVLLAEPAPELLVLDEPTNDLDIASVDQLVAALASFRGALLVVSHDQRFLDRLGLDAVLRLEDGGNLVEVG